MIAAARRSRSAGSIALTCSISRSYSRHARTTSFVRAALRSRALRARDSNSTTVAPPSRTSRHDRSIIAAIPRLSIIGSSMARTAIRIASRRSSSFATRGNSPAAFTTRAANVSIVSIRSPANPLGLRRSNSSAIAFATPPDATNTSMPPSAIRRSATSAAMSRYRARWRRGIGGFGWSLYWSSHLRPCADNVHPQISQIYADGVRVAMSDLEIITVVLDPECGDGIFELAQRGPVWATASAPNRAAVEKYWKTASNDANEVTIWSTPRTGETKESWLGILDDLERHHGEFAGPGIGAIEVVGAELTGYAQAALREFGYEPAEAGPNGFRAVRANRDGE